ncbi:Hypothetical predicted protein [Olea europaea subsp. europaea]|uniref:Uncharacterized protein n=1 Tax=Olea europaea subsp. europaea TaxID=158383 RepID=A0A8S0TUT3_OLEEU|nr:Hypothetical predicted protein [Olea europaea subsp. europaea]
MEIEEMVVVVYCGWCGGGVLWVWWFGGVTGTVVARDGGAHVVEVMVVLEAVVPNYCCVVIDVDGGCGDSDEWAVCDQQLGVCNQLFRHL